MRQIKAGRKANTLGERIVEFESEVYIGVDMRAEAVYIGIVVCFGPAVLFPAGGYAEIPFIAILEP